MGRVYSGESPHVWKSVDKVLWWGHPELQSFIALASAACVLPQEDCWSLPLCAAAVALSWAVAHRDPGQVPAQ